MDFTIAPPGPTINSIFKDAPADKLWSSSPDVLATAGSAWLLDFSFGHTNSSFIETSSSFRARCVRAPAPKCYPARYHVTMGLVQDQTTGLTWQQMIASASRSEAETLCSNLGAGWRLPSVTELQTIVDDTKEAWPVIDTDAFPDTPGGLNDVTQFWTSSPSARAAAHAWYVDFHSGFSSDEFAVAASLRVRCVH